MRWGPERLAPGRWRFALWAPERESMSLEFEDGRSLAMEPRPEGWFAAEAEAQAGAAYRFRLDPSLAVPDPASRAQRGGPHGWSLLHDQERYRWRYPDWRGRPWSEAVIQEVHAGVLGGFAGVADKLPALAELGITAVQLMPVAAFGGARNWGYDGVLPYAVAESYGSPDALKALVDRAHELGLMVFLDVVYNHFGPDGNYLHAFAESFFDAGTHTPWGPAIAFAREPVRRFFIDNALMWLEDYRLDGLRLDAVHAIGNNAFLDAMAGQIRAKLPGRQVHLVLENEGNDAERLRDGGYDAQWNDDFHNSLHVVLTGESEGYYAGFADDPTARLARCLAEGFAYQGETPPGDHAEPRGTPSAHLPPTRFVAFLHNHDQIGNRALGERLTVLVEPARLRAATALLLLCPQIPLLFMGDESGSQTPFLFLTDFHDELADAVREGRRKEFAHFAAFSDPAARERIPDPNAETTFATSNPQPGPEAEHWRALYAELLGLRHRHLIPRLPGTSGLGCEVLGNGALAARWRLGDGAVLSIAINLGDEAVTFPEVGEQLFRLGQAGQPASVLVGTPIMSDLHLLAEAAGLQIEWRDAAGQRQRTGDEALSRVLEPLGYPAGNENEIADSLARCRAQVQRRGFITADCGRPVELPPGSGEAGAAELQLEDGSTHQVHVARTVAGLCLPPIAEPGYHRLCLAKREIGLAVAPARCFGVEEATGGRRVWGAAVQVPALRDGEPRAFGDFGSLAHAARQFAARGADALGISPVHALFPADPSRFSPYAPSSRAFLNILFADTSLVGHPLPPGEGGHLIDWQQAIPARVAALRQAFEALREQLSERLAEFRTQEGEDLVRHATFDALHARFFAEGAHGWQGWPREFHDPAGESVARFAEQNRDEVEFYIFGQWLARQGLDAAQQAATDAGMKVGLISDLAVGLDGGGSHAWSKRGELLEGLSVGAPPDILGPQGQDWGLTTFSPEALRASGFEPLIATLRANIDLCGGIRIDHALGLNRLWVVPQGCSPAEGAYLRYPLDDMLRILALESRRARAVVIGEDLGTVPEGLRDKLEQRDVLGMRVLWFEREHDGGFVPPERWQRQAVAMTGTHDLFTVAGWWSERDIDWARKLDRSAAGSNETDERETRGRERKALWSAMRASNSAEGEPPLRDDPRRAVDAAAAHVASTPAMLALFPLEDVVGLPEQPNLPGTIDEHPNWRRRMPDETGALLGTEEVSQRIVAINERRGA